jgi:hypothetical protein
MLEWKPRLVLLVLVALTIAALLAFWGHNFHHPANYGW